MRHIDHVVIAVRDLDHAADLYSRLGLQVGARNQHPWGTENRIVQFHHSFIELVTVGSNAERIPPHRPRHFSFGSFIQDYLGQREGIAMLVLSSSDAASDAALFARRGIGNFEPFTFERTAKRPDGSEHRVAFTLAFTTDASAPLAGFFVCQHHFPENFWASDFQRHRNTAADIAAVTLDSPDPDWQAEFVSQFSGAEKRALPNGGFRLALDEGRVDVISPAMARWPTLASSLFTSITLRVAELATVTRILDEQGLGYTNSDGSMVVTASTPHGVALRFEE